MKKFIAVLLSAVMLLGLLAGCGAQTPAPETTEGTYATPMAAGMVVLYANAAVNVSYDADGLVLSIEGVDDYGSALAGEYEDYLGKSCSEVVCDLIGNSFIQGLMTNENNYVMIKLAVGSAMPGSTFMESMQKDAEAAIAEAGSTAKLVVLTTENLDAEGYIDLESAKALMLAALALDGFDSLDGAAAPSEGAYTFTITAGALAGTFKIDAVTGAVYEGEPESNEFEEEDVDVDLDVNVTTEPFVDTAPATTAAASTEATESAGEENA